jgi:hypothetical protein
MLGASIGNAVMTNMGQGHLSNNNLVSTQHNAYNQAITRGSFSMSPRVSIEIDRVTNGYVLAVGSERMIAKDLEELQAQIIAQVVSKLVLEEGK